MHRVGAWMGWLIAGIACLWIATAAAPCRAAETTLWMPGGGLVSVWEAPLHGAQGGHPGGAFLAYAVADAQDLRIGTVQATIGPDRDADPSLTIDPASGHPVLVWSHGDRGNLKIAYARFEAGLWVDVHDLTFGPGDDLLPRIGRSATGSYLFWVTGEGRYLYAPLDLSGGRLFGAPQSLLAASDTASTDQIPLGGGGLATVQGGSDVPVVTGETNSAQVLGGETAKTGLLAPSGSTDESPAVDDAEATDNERRALWGVASRADCRSLIVTLPGREAKSLRVVRFLNGVVTTLGDIPVRQLDTPHLGDALAASYLPATCD